MACKANLFSPCFVENESSPFCLLNMWRIYLIQASSFLHGFNFGKLANFEVLVHKFLYGEHEPKSCSQLCHPPWLQISDFSRKSSHTGVVRGKE